MSAGDEPRRVGGLEVTPAFFDVLGVRPAAGRTFTADEGTEGRQAVALISQRVWQTMFAADLAAVGRQVLLNDVPHTVVGILPAGFGADIRPGLDVVVPTTPSHPLARSRAIRTYQVVARLRPGASIGTARAALETIGARLEAAYPDTNARRQFTAVPLIDEIVGDVRTPLTLISWAVGAVLLLVCANVANLLLARATWRRREMAVRLALGAPRSRLLRQVLTESVLLAAIGGGAGAAVSYWFAKALLQARGAGLPRVDGDVDPYVAAIGVAATLVVGVVTGLLPAGFAARISGGDVLREARSSGGRHAVSMSKALVVVQTGVAVLLLAAAGVLSSSLLAVLRVPAGFDARDGISLRIDLPDTRYPTRASNAAFFTALTTDVASIPLVRRAGVASALPLSGQDTGSALSIFGRPTALADLPTVRWQVAAPGYFSSMGIPLLSGRDYAPEDLRRTHVSIVSASVEREFFPGESAIGKRIYCGLPSSTNPDWHEIIGVVGDVRHARLDAEPRPRVYDLLGQHATGSGFLVVRTRDAASVLPEVRAAIRRLDPGLAVFDVRTLEEMTADSVAPRRFLALLIGLAGVLSLAIAAIGIYGVVGYIVARRRHEMGIRLALGAAPGDLKALVLKQGLLLAVGGIVAGSIGAALVAPALGSQVFGARSGHATALAAGALVFVAVSLLASYLPARRATRVDPLTVLRHE
jgi:putative ABC transport system permease protein